MSRGVSGQLSLKQTRRLLERLVEEVPAIRRGAGLEADTCVDQTSLAVQVIRYAGGRVRPFAVKVQAQGPDGTVYRLGYDPLPAERYNGHLVALVAERYLLDLSADQFAEKIKLPICPFWTEVGRGFVRGEAAIGFEVEGGEFRYYPNPTDKDWVRPVDGCATGTAWRPNVELARGVLEAIGWRP